MSACNTDARGTLLSFRERFKTAYAADDTDMPECILAAYVVNMLPIDPVWLMIVGSPSGGKTAALSILSELPDTFPISTVTQAALLSGSPKREIAKDATGGVLRELGERGVITIKDFSTILSSNKDTLTSVIAAFREMYDGSLTRTFGTDGGRKETWRGKVTVIAAVTQALDQKHEVIALLGERFLTIRLKTNSELSLRMTRKALEDGPEEREAKDSLSRLAKAIVSLVNVPGRCEPLPRSVKDGLTTLADLVSQCRSPIERDGRTREIDGVPFREEGPRLARQLASLYRGLLTIGNTEQEAWDKVRRIALDSMPELRRRAIFSLKACDTPERTSVIAQACNCPTTTTRRALEDLAYLGLIQRHGTEYQASETWELAEKTRDALEGISYDILDDEPPFDVQGILGQGISPENGTSLPYNEPAHTRPESRVSLPKGRRKTLKAHVDNTGKDGNGLAVSQ
jgi:hypothetical protein